jgi:hypothetical protein
MKSEMQRLMWCAVSRADLAEIRNLFEMGASVDKADMPCEDGVCSPLAFAYKKGDEPLIECLKALGASLMTGNEASNWAVWAAIEGGYVEDVREILKENRLEQRSVSRCVLCCKDKKKRDRMIDVLRGVPNDDYDAWLREEKIRLMSEGDGLPSVAEMREISAWGVSEGEVLLAFWNKEKVDYPRLFSLMERAGFDLALPTFKDKERYCEYMGEDALKSSLYGFNYDFNMASALVTHGKVKINMKALRDLSGDSMWPELLGILGGCEAANFVKAIVHAGCSLRGVECTKVRRHEGMEDQQLPARSNLLHALFATVSGEGIVWEEGRHEYIKDMCRALVAGGVDVRAKDANGDTPAMLIDGHDRILLDVIRDCQRVRGVQEM